MGWFRKAAGLIAGLILILAGGGLVYGSPLVGGVLLLIGVAATAWQGWLLWQSARRDPYDLSRLWERDDATDTGIDADEPDDWNSGGDPDEPEYLYCHRCGHAVPPPHTRCPECGAALG